MRQYLLRTGGAFEPAAIEQMSGAFGDALAAITAHPENYVIPDPRELSEADAQILTLLARQAEQLMELQWRRQLEAPPQPREVGELAAAIHDTTSFSEA